MNNFHLLLRSSMPFALVAAMGVTVSPSALAATETTTFQVTATVLDSCLVSATDLAFGDYDPNSDNDLNASSVVTATCTAGTDYEIALDTGNNSGDAIATSRAMGDGSSNFLDYEMYLDAARSIVWNTSSPGNVVSNSSALAGINTHTVYGQIPTAQYVAAGSYTDTINVTLTY